jgi:hypothetical protein
VPPELERLPADRIGNLEIPYLFPDLDEIDEYERCEDRKNEGADEEAEGYFSFKRHNSHYHRAASGRNQKNL